MSIQDLIRRLGEHPAHLIAAFVAVPLFALVYGRVLTKGRGGLAPHKYVFAVLVYAACVPGIFSSVITAYTMLFTRKDLLGVNCLVYFLPIISMIVSIVIIRRAVDLDDVPGFDRLVGLCVLLAITFGVSLALLKLRVLVLFGGPLRSLVILAIFVFFLLKWAAHKLLRGGGEPDTAPPQFPDI